MDWAADIAAPSRRIVSTVAMVRPKMKAMRASSAASN
jgi:hypothetical protein